MGKLILENVIQALKAGGIPTDSAMPAGRIPHITEPVAAVSLKEMDMRKQKATVLVTILAPASLGGTVCEETALDAASILAGLGGKVLVDQCGFDSSTGLFTEEITAQFWSYIPKIRVNDEPMLHVISFKSWREKVDETTSWNLLPWYFEIKDFVPQGETEDPYPSKNFQLVHTTEGGTETFVNCNWLYQQRVGDASGLWQIQRGVAEQMDAD